eukprot:TRINITY_DN2063_c0_g1_i5.p1 TRINITY_DN2063_c0_g1~~TRINITY_DN2063_c0_g1_i5.p1  ORF type:complete len:1048 (-),score=188.96 TRINITY_DN2063_c0_g1_i5:16-3159(-)
MLTSSSLYSLFFVVILSSSSSSSSSSWWGVEARSIEFLTTSFEYYLVPRNVHGYIPLIIWNPQFTQGQYVVSLKNDEVPSAGFNVTFSLLPNSEQVRDLPITYTKTSPQNITFYSSITTTSASVGASSQVTVQLASASDRATILSSFTITLNVVQYTLLPKGKARPFLYVDNSTRTDPPKKEIIQTLIQTGQERLNSDLRVPQAWGAWYGYFYCSDGTPLVFNSENNTAFWCPSQKVWYTGEIYQKSWYTYRHNQLFASLQDLSIGYWLSGYEQMGRAAVTILLEYSVFYPAFPFRDINENPSFSGGRVLSQTLDESNAVAPSLAMAFDLVAAMMTPAEHALVEFNLLRSMAATIKRNNAGMSNWQTWHNAAMATVGFAVNEPLLVDYAINGSSSGFLFQLKNALSDDGFWWENSLGYHYYTLRAMQWLLFVCSRSGLDLSLIKESRLDGKGDKYIEMMYFSPLDIVEPLSSGWAFPSLNDDHSMDDKVVNVKDVYLYANWQWGPSGRTPSPHRQAYSWVLGMQGGSTSPQQQLMWGAPIVPGTFQPSSIDLSATGLTVFLSNLTSSLGSDYALIKHGPHGGWHGHYDKLELLFVHGGVSLLSDYGTVEYTEPLHYDYFKRTLSHNTIMVDALTQQEANGTTILFEDTLDKALVASTFSSDLIPGVYGERTIVLLPDFDGTGRSVMLDLLAGVDRNKSSSSKQHDYFSIYHSAGTFKIIDGPSLVPFSIPYTSVDPSWSFLKNASTGSVPAGAPLRYSWSSSSTIQKDYDDDNSNMASEVIGLEVVRDQVNGAASEIIVAMGPNQPATSYHPVIISKLSGGDNLFSNLLISPPLDPNTPVKFYSNLKNASAPSFYITLGDKVAEIDMIASSPSSSPLNITSAVVRFSTTSSSTIKSVYGYNVAFLSPFNGANSNQIGLASSSATRPITGQILAYTLDTSSSSCSLTFAVRGDAPAQVVCEFEVLQMQQNNAQQVVTTGHMDGVIIPKEDIQVTVTQTHPTLSIIRVYVPVHPSPSGTHTIDLHITPPPPSRDHHHDDGNRKKVVIVY